MARAENPIPADSGAVGELARRLRLYRDNAGLNYRQLADQTHFSYSQLSRAASGKSLPTWEITEAYLRGCGITGVRSLEVLRRLWEAAARTRRPARRPSRYAVPLGNVRTREQFGKVLRTLAYREDGGWVSMRDIARLTDQSKSNVSAWFSGKTMPQQAALDQFATLLGATEAEKADLRDARIRVLHGGEAATTAGVQLLDELEPTVDEQTFLRALLTVVDGAVNVEHPGDDKGNSRRFVRRRAAGTPTWEPGDGEKLDQVLQHVRGSVGTTRTSTRAVTVQFR
ncbi:helix-turn-helix domain-containing protein (plasmid) [Kribbella sp. WER1]